MREATLTRYYLPQCTLGVMKAEGLLLCTMEQPWHQNKPFVSCIPEGKYSVTRDVRPSHPNTFCLVNHSNDVYQYPAPGMRDSILIHVGNWVKDIEGCIAPGMEFGVLKDENVVIKSVAAFRALQKWVGGDYEFSLNIEQYKPEDWR